MSELKMSFGAGTEVAVELREGRTPTVEALLASVPFESSANRWGDEVYFDTPVSAELEADSRASMEVGDVAYWPEGRALAVFFGPTPVSTDGRPRAYSPCNIVGRVIGDTAGLKLVRTGDSVRVHK